MVAVLVDFEGAKGEVIIIDISNNTFVKLGKALRGVSTKNANIELSDDGNTVATHSVADNLFYFYQLIEDKWSMTKGNIECKSMALSSNLGVLAIISSNTDAAMVFHRNTYCENGFSNVRLTFTPDNFPNELLWEMVNVTVSGNIINVMKKGGPYETAEAMIVEELCVNNDVINSTNKSGINSCIGFRIFDLGLNGLRSPGKIGISVNGTVKWNISLSNGYENIFPVLGNIACMDAMEKNS